VATGRTARGWLAVGALVLLFLAGRAALRPFGVQTTLSDGARAFASCKAPWQSARIADPARRFTLSVVTGGTGQRRTEAVVELGARCRRRARRRLGVAAVLLAGTAVVAWLALRRRNPAPEP